MKTDQLGRVYVCGQTDVATHVSASAYQPGIAGGSDAFVACLDPSLPSAQQLVWSTHFGGSGDELAMGLHVDAMGTRVTIVGRTDSGDLPTLGAWQPQSGGGRDGFVAVFDPASSGTAQLQSATYLGGSDSDVAMDVDVTAGMMTIVGSTDSINFPTQAPWQANRAGGRDLFVTRFLPNGSPLFSTYLGGTGNDGLSIGSTPIGEGSVHLAIDSAGVVTLASGTYSLDYPIVGSVAHGVRGNYDIVVSQLDVIGNVIYSTILAGTENDICHSLRADTNGHLVLAGSTASGNFPITPNAVQGVQGGDDVLLVHLDIANDQILYATCLGGTDNDYGKCAYREPSGAFVLAGYSRSGDFQATAGAPQPQATTNFPLGYMTRLKPGATSTDVQFMTWFGGTAGQTFVDIEPDGRGGVVAAGPTISPDFPISGNAFSQTMAGVRDGWIAVHPMLPALMTRYGHASNVCEGSSYLQVNSAPLAGNAGFEVEAHDAPANTIGLVAFGTPMPAGIPALGVDVFVAPAIATATLLTDANGFTSLPLPIPAAYAWNGQLALQTFWLTPASCPGGFLTSSNALR